MVSIKKINLFDNLNWNDLVRQSKTGTFFQTKEWLGLWARHFGKEVIIFAVYNGNDLIGIAPFEKRENNLILLGTAAVLGEELVSDYGDIIAKTSYENIIWKEVLAKIKNPALPAGRQKSNIKKIKCDYIREESPSLSILKEFGGKSEEVDVAPYLDLPNSWEEYLAILDRHDRHELRRKIRKLEKERALKICHDGNPADMNEFFRLIMLANEQKRDFLSDKMRKFFEGIFEVFLPKKILRLCFLKLEGKNIASVLSFVYNKQLLLYNSGFDPEYQKLSPGLILKAYMIKYAIEEKLTRLDFLRGGERYKFDLGGIERKLYKITL